ncbi:MAG: hypothetical protein U1E65_19045 [Myxococcota bacterium]
MTSIRSLLAFELAQRAQELSELDDLGGGARIQDFCRFNDHPWAFESPSMPSSAYSAAMSWLLGAYPRPEPADLSQLLAGCPAPLPATTPQALLNQSRCPPVPTSSQATPVTTPTPAPVVCPTPAPKPTPVVAPTHTRQNVNYTGSVTINDSWKNVTIRDGKGNDNYVLRGDHNIVTVTGDSKKNNFTVGGTNNDVRIFELGNDDYVNLDGGKAAWRKTGSGRDGKGWFVTYENPSTHTVAKLVTDHPEWGIATLEKHIR